MSPRAPPAVGASTVKTPTSGHHDAAVHARTGSAATTIATRCRIGVGATRSCQLGVRPCLLVRSLPTAVAKRSASGVLTTRTDMP
jgi:hypothetical protein